jgi:uncharacterized protein (TIGR02271 family)
MPTINDVQTWRGRNAVDPDGDKVGTIEDIYLDRQSGEPEWAAVKTGLFGTKVNLVPLEGATPAGNQIRLAYDKATIKDAPNVEADGELSPEEERRLYDHYGRGDYADWDDSSEDRTEGVLGRDERVRRGDEDVRGFTGDDDASDARGTVGRDPTTGFAGGARRPETDDAMTRSEEELRVGTEKRETGRARLRKFVVTENVERTVPVQREEVRVEREPITDANRDAALSGGDITEEEHEVTLHAEEPVVQKDVVPKERVRMDTDVVTDERQISDEVRKERIKTEGDTR